ncbi:MAG: hypothetical protein ACE5GD_00065 [Candidatus Geothermarchaeales archaeon]
MTSEVENGVTVDCLDCTKSVRMEWLPNHYSKSKCFLSLLDFLREHSGHKLRVLE